MLSLNYILFVAAFLVMIGEWWDLADLGEIDRHLRHYVADNFFKASTINGKLGDLYNCSGNNQTVIR
jgi:hypothetical protein